MTVALKLNSFTISKSNQSLGGDDYFFDLLTSFPSKYPAPQHKPIRAIKASQDKVIILAISSFFRNNGTIYHLYVNWACIPRWRATVLPTTWKHTISMGLKMGFVK